MILEWNARFRLCHLHRLQAAIKRNDLKGAKQRLSGLKVRSLEQDWSRDDLS